MSKIYVQNPVYVEAIQWKENNTQQVLDFFGKNHNIKVMFDMMGVDGDWVVSKGQFVVRTCDGDLFAMNRRTFERNYRGVN